MQAVGLRPERLGRRVSLVLKLLLCSLLVLATGAAIPIANEASRSQDENVAGGVTLRDHCSTGFILKANGSAMLVLVTGAVSAGSLTIAGLTSIGHQLSTDVLTARRRGLMWSQLAAAILPHFILELPALLLAGAAGLSGLPLLWAVAAGAARWRPVIYTAAACAVTSAVLLSFAAAVECNVTPIVIRWTS